MADVSMSDGAGRAGRRLPPVRPERAADRRQLGYVGAVERPLSLWERLYGYAWLRRLFILVVLAVAWELYARWINNPLMLPSFSEVVGALYEETVHGPLIDRTFTTIQVLLIGYSLGLTLAAVLTTLAVSTRLGNDVLSTLTAMFNPLPAIALLPLALLWFGLGMGSIVFVIVHSVLWAVALNTHSGFQSVSETMRMAGQTFGLKGLRYIFGILVPAALPAIVSGLKIGWAFAWRTLIAAELVFGASSRSGGLGWFIFENRVALETPYVFAGLLTVILIGLAIESLVFRTLETHTLRKWGMQR